MFGAKFVLAIVVALWLSESNFHFEVYGDALGDVIPTPTSCEHCPNSKCDPSCQQVTTPPPPSSPSGYSIYGAPPPPHEKGQSKCPPAPGVQCCTPPAPYTYGYGYGYGPPNSYYAPPNPYTYVPYGGGQGLASMILPILIPPMMLFSSFIV
ncbi:hypothetical protein Fmac_030520 [Flemingia macrophylla]|uniref:Uncharacterized protein n=1 Tax=Flemingia macrophylla TaxID=520843 RepID=A0ABD1KZG3_9FABA